MLNIEKKIFGHNLSLTQEYCRLQLGKQQHENAQVFRSYNPTLNGKALFDFKVEHFDFEIQPNLRSCTITQWSVDPTQRENKYLVDQLFEQQINVKAHLVSVDPSRIYQGDILISLIDCSVMDGVSEVQSLGLVDIYDMPPIDTWFYMAKNEENRLLFAWVPKELRYYANEAVLVNCVDCLNWFQALYPQDYEQIMAYAQHGNDKSGV